MKTIYLVRHGETQANRDDLFRGRSEIPLSETGRAQAAALRDWFGGRPLQRVCVSPLRRAVETAEIAFPGRPLQRDRRLNNLDLGNWTGRAKAAIRRDEPALWRRWLRRPETMVFPGGESLGDVRRRCRRLLAALRRGGETEVALVSHRAVLKVLLAEALGIETNYFWRFHLDNASVTVLFHDPERGFILYKANVTEHLAGTLFEPY